MRYELYTGVKRIKSKIDIGKSLMGLMALALPAIMVLTIGAARAATMTVVVTPAHSQGWGTADTRPGGEVNFVSDSSSPYPSGALQLKTDSTNSAKAQYMHEASVPLDEVTELSYYTKQNSASFAGGDASYQLPMFLNGSSGFTTLVYEPYQGGGGAVVPGTWQSWNVDAGLFWSTRTVTCSNGVVLGGAGGPAIHTLEAVKTACPEAIVLGFGVNIGSFNPAYDVEVDGVNFNGTTYDFELTNVPSSKDNCKQGGWMSLTDQNGQAFKNQGQCVSWTNGRGQ